MTRPTPSSEPRKAVDARRVAGSFGSGSQGGEFTYSVLPDMPATSPINGDRRRSPRQRTRLRSGKLAAINGSFLTECLIYDLSVRGCRLRCSSTLDLPRSVQLFDDQSGLLHRCVVLWRDDGNVGVRFEPQPDPRHAREISDALQRKFYRVRD